MTQKAERSAKAKLESAAAATAAGRYELKLYVAGATAASLRAIANIKAICEQYLKGRYDLKVVDVYDRPAMLRVDQIVAVPTLIKKLPPPMRCLVGDLSRTERVLRGLDLVARTP
jgi:circadian clock protein KaiB